MPCKFEYETPKAIQFKGQTYQIINIFFFEKSIKTKKPRSRLDFFALLNHFYYFFLSTSKSFPSQITSFLSDE